MDTNFAENIKKLREKHSLTQEAVAESLEVSELDVYRWEAARSRPGYKMIAKIADFYDVTVESLFAGEADENNKPAASDKISFNCKICGGDLVYNYPDGTCRCENCRNKWVIAELYPKYARVMATIIKANKILDTKTDLASADEADLLFRQAIEECSRFSDMLSTELIKLCEEGQAKAEQLEIYCRGKHFFDNKAYKSAVIELQKVRGFRDADEMLKRCKRGI
ncbi:MAG: helix-turn-helix domain-containing protein [Saccharofermentans sp.]|nr:helix-turn-helix domain-containing protein [Saccharofermentans sp.]